jgi:hypothetical protein
VEALIRVHFESHGHHFKPRDYRTLSALLKGISGRWLVSADSDQTHTVVLLTDHEAWKPDFDPALFRQAVDEAIADYETIGRILYDDSGMVIGMKDTYEADVKAWELRTLPKLQAAAKGSIK